MLVFSEHLNIVFRTRESSRFVYVGIVLRSSSASILCTENFEQSLIAHGIKIIVSFFICKNFFIIIFPFTVSGPLNFGGQVWNNGGAIFGGRCTLIINAVPPIARPILSVLLFGTPGALQKR